MPKTDAYGQGINIATRTDAMDGAKLADDLASGIIPRTVMRFATAAERNATLTSPIAGMVAWLSAEKVFTGYDGAAWVVLAAGTSSWTTVSLASPWTHDANDNGTFQYRLVNLFGEPTLHFRGAIGRASYPSSVPSSFQITATQLPVAARPTTKRTPLIPVSDVGSTRIALKMDIQTNGHLSVWGFGTSDKPAWIGFNGVMCSL